MQLQPYQKVIILDGSPDYHGKYGIVTDIVEGTSNTDGIALIMCVDKPWDRYWLYEGQEDKVWVI
jgi:hypothetical protein